MPSQPSKTSSPTPYTVPEDETLRLALTFMTLPSSSSNRATTPPPHASQPDTLSPSSIGSWVDLPSDTSPAMNDSASPPRSHRRRHKLRSGLSNLANKPSPFGTQLEPASRSTPYNHTPTRDQRRFNPRPTPRELSVENDKVPRPDPDDVYDTFSSACESAKTLAMQWGDVAAKWLTDNGRKDLTLEVTKIGLWALVVFRPRWVLRGMNFSYSVIRDPWRVYHHTFITFVMTCILNC